MCTLRTVVMLTALRCIDTASELGVAAEGEDQRENGHLRCPLGKYRLPSSDVCRRCPVGKFSSALTRIMVASHDVCMQCPTGRISDAPRTACVTTCDASTAASAGAGGERMYQHRVAHRGRRGATAAVIVACEYCPAGQYARRKRMPWERSVAPSPAPPCIQCAMGRYTSTPGAGPWGCKACPQGKYAARNGATHCENLSVGMVGAAVGASGRSAAQGASASGLTAGKWFAAHEATAYCFAAVILAFVASLAYVLRLSGPGSADKAVDIELQHDADGAATAGEGRGLLPAPASSAGAQLGVDRPI